MTITSEHFKKSKTKNSLFISGKMFSQQLKAINVFEIPGE
jgi:hypothetical protein